MKNQAPHVALANQYARGVISGNIIACKWVRLACERHLKDLKRQKEKGFSYRFNPERATRACQFMEGLPHTKGKWAKPVPGQPRANLLTLQPWQCFIVCSIFGWLAIETGYRRFSVALVMVPRKNGKSDFAARVGLYMMVADDEFGAEVYSGATSEKQAWEVFRPAWMMAKRSEQFRKHFGVTVNAKTLCVLENGSRFEPLIGDPGDGSSPSCAIVDEYHEHDSDGLYSTMETGMGAREQPLMLVISTAGDNIAGPCYQMQLEAQKMLEGILDDERLFAIIYTIDKDEDWATEDALIKANPNFGVSVSGEFLLGKLASAKQSARKQARYKTKHLNIWVSARSPWMNMQWWNACADPELRIEQFKGDPCYLGLDLASRIDIAARMAVFPRMIDGIKHYYIFGKYYLPESALEEDKADHYRQWSAEGHITLTDGEEIDLTEIQEDILGWDDNGVITGGLVRDAEIKEIAYDPWQATQLAQNLTAEGALAVEFRNTVGNMSPAMKEIEAAAKAGRLHHDGDPVLAWMISNVVAKEDAKENVFPRKDVAENKIDGAVALIFAIARAMVGEVTRSVYSERGIFVID